jgi:hypothetical protein
MLLDLLAGTDPNGGYVTLDERRQRPAQNIQRTIEIRVVAAALDLEAGVRDRGAIATEHRADFRQRHAAADVRQVHRDLTRFGDVSDASRSAPKEIRINAEDVRNREINCNARLAVAQVIHRFAIGYETLARLQGR